MASAVTSRRIPLIALALSLMSAGVGHLYCGRIRKGLALYFAWFLVPLCVTIAAVGPPTFGSLVMLILLPVAGVFAVYCYAAIDAWRLAYQIGSNYTTRDYNRAATYWLLIVIQLLYPIGLIAGVRGMVYEAYVIPTSSMAPTILKGDRILVRKLLPQHHFPERGDLIAFRNPGPTGGTTFVKRVIAVAGDHVEVTGGRVLVNGKELERDRMPEGGLKLFREQPIGEVSYEVNSGHRYLVGYGGLPEGSLPPDDFETTVPDRHVFVLGDNRDRSRDSRNFGPIHIGEVVGHVDYIYWPAASWSRFGVVNNR